MSIELAKRRLSPLAALLLLPLLWFVWTLWRLQIIDADIYRRAAQNNTLRQIDLVAQRGGIFDREGRPLSQNAVRYILKLSREAWLADRAGVTRLALQLGYGPEILRKAEAATSSEPLILDRDARFEVAAHLKAHQPEYPGFYLTYDSRRIYPHGVSAAHLIGYLGAAGPEEMRDDPALRPGAQLGRGGIERGYNRQLSGRYGSRQMLVNSLGREVALPGFKPVPGTPPVPGQSLQLALDLNFQQVIDAAFAGRGGAAVFLDPRNGDVLALTSSPAYNLNDLSGRIRPEVWQALQADPGAPFINRATEAAYAPGSVWKVVMALAALSNGAIRPETRFYCNQKINIYNREWNCTGRHGELDLVHAIEKSCNIYFYNVGMKLGMDRLETFGQQLGIGRLTGIALGSGENPGIMPGPQWKRAEFARRVANKWVEDTPGNNWMKNWYAGETLSAAIGQGQLQMTPLQVARLMATIASGGKVFVPRVVTRESDRELAPQFTTVALDPEALRVVKEGMCLVVNGNGTAHGAALPDIKVCGKTGTAQLVGDETVQKKGGRKGGYLAGFRENSWFAGYAPAENPEIAFAILVEQGGHGSEAAAPIARTALDWWFHQRGKATPQELQPQLRLVSAFGEGPITIAPAQPLNAPPPAPLLMAAKTPGPAAPTPLPVRIKTTAPTPAVAVAPAPAPEPPSEPARNPVPDAVAAPAGDPASPMRRQK